MMYPDYQPVRDEANRKKFEAAWGVPLDPTPGLTVVEIMKGAWTGRVRGMFMMGENPFLSDPNTNKVRKALASLEFLAVQDIFLTETAEFADVVLPASSFFEKEGTYTNTDRRVQIGRPALAAARRRPARLAGDLRDQPPPRLPDELPHRRPRCSPSSRRCRRATTA